MTLSVSNKFFNRMDNCSLLFSFLSQKEQDVFAKVSKLVQQIKTTYSIRGYKNLMQRLNRSDVLIIKDVDKIYTIYHGKFLGSGGNKQAIKISNNEVLLIPNNDCLQHLDSTMSYWPRLVQEEVGVARIFTRLGLLTPVDRQVMLLPSIHSTSSFVPAYISHTFESLAKKGIFFLSHTETASTWRRGEDFLIATKEERLQEKNWDPLFEPILEDLSLIFQYQLPAFDDAFHVAIVKNNLNQFAIRYFAFDFAGRFASLEIPALQKASDQINLKMVKMRLSEIVDMVFCWESGGFGEEYSSYEALRTGLIEKYAENVMLKIQTAFS
jgi:hypothetical protein